MEEVWNVSFICIFGITWYFPNKNSRSSQHQAVHDNFALARNSDSILKMQEQNKAAFLYLPLLFAVFSILQYIKDVEKSLGHRTSRRFRMTSPLHLCCLLHPASAKNLNTRVSINEKIAKSNLLSFCCQSPYIQLWSLASFLANAANSLSVSKWYEFWFSKKHAEVEEGNQGKKHFSIIFIELNWRTLNEIYTYTYMNISFKSCKSLIVSRIFQAFAKTLVVSSLLSSASLSTAWENLENDRFRFLELQRTAITNKFSIGIHIWMFPKIGVVSPQIIHFNRVFHYKPSILGAHPYLWKHPYLHLTKNKVPLSFLNNFNHFSESLVLAILESTNLGYHLAGGVPTPSASLCSLGEAFSSARKSLSVGHLWQDQEK